MNNFNFFSTTNPALCRRIAAAGLHVAIEPFKTAPNGHKYSVGEKAVLVGLKDYPEYNGETVEISAIREDGPYGKAYYIKGRINDIINWVYEYRLSSASKTQVPLEEEV